MNPAMEAEHNRVKGVLIDTISLLCKSSLTYTNQLKIEGVIGITVDGCIFLVHVDQQFGPSDAEDINQNQFNSSSGIQIKSEQEMAQGFHNSSQTGAKKPREGQQKTVKNPNVHVKVEPSQIKDEPHDFFSSPPPRKRQRNQNLLTQGNRHVVDNNVEISLLDDFAEEEEQSYGMQENFGDTFDPTYEIQDEASGDWSYETQRKPTKTRAARSHGGTRRSSNSRRNTSYGQDGTSLVITESSHICGYPSCYKRFKFRHDLLRHQTKKHGRKPAFTRARMSNAAASNSEDYYYGEDESTFEAANDGDYEYGYQ